jgi:hypothetical protein
MVSANAYAFAGRYGLFVTLGLLIVGWRQGRRLQQLMEQLKE